ncbi:hypothetical protein Ocin01_19386 [Orchesella cincta]|uniref:Uncharacterized protein n=1 Tax=Orchesella cincta TaxID=48709 RepID=A0A1D2M2W2_ORCCI|nr:hypothetical protein Ocin01_19386 [Orchesella cincta]
MKLCSIKITSGQIYKGDVKVHNYTDGSTATSQTSTVGVIPGSDCNGNHDASEHCLQSPTSNNLEGGFFTAKLIYMNGCFAGIFQVQFSPSTCHHNRYHQHRFSSYLYDIAAY